MFYIYNNNGILLFQSCDKGNVEPKKESNVKNSNHAPITLKLSGCIRHKPNEPIPLVDDWTVQQVSDYFLEKFGKDVADAFQTQVCWKFKLLFFYYILKLYCDKRFAVFLCV